MIRPRLSLAFLALCGVTLFASSPRLEAQTNLGSVNLGSSTAMTVTVPLSAAATLSSVAVVTGGAAKLDFTDAGGGTCVTGSTLSTSCTVQVSFAPKFAGLRSGAVVLADATGVIATVYLRGNGVGPQAVFGTTRPTPVAIPVTVTGLPSSVAVDGSGNVYLGDSGDPTYTFSSAPTARVLKETPSGGTYTQTVVAAGFYGPQSIGIDGAGNLYIHDVGNGSANSDAVYKEVLLNAKYTQSLVTVIPYANGLTDATLTSVTVDGIGNVYFLGFANTGVPAGVFVDTLKPDGSYFQTGPLPAPNFTIPNESCSSTRTDSVAVDGNGIVYLNGYVNCSGTFESYTLYETYAYSSGIGNTPVSIPAVEIQLPLTQPSLLPAITSLLADSEGDLYFWTTLNTNTKFSEYIPNADGLGFRGVNTSTSKPYGVAVDAGGNILFSDAGDTPSNEFNGGVFRLDFADPPTLTFEATATGVVGPDSPQEVFIGNIGNAPLDITSYSYPPDFPASTPILNPATCTTTNPLGPEEMCAIEVEFLPVNTPPAGTNQVLTESVNLVSNLMSSPSAITVTGTVEGLPAAATPTFSPAGGTYTAAQTVTLSDTTPNATIYYTLDGSTPTTSSSKYSSAISITGPDTIKAIAIASGYEPSAVATATYSIVLPADFTFTIAPSALTVTAGQSGSASASIQSQNGFAAAITFACSGLPAGATCSFSPATVTPSGTAAVPVTVTIAVPSSLGALHSQPIPTDSRHLPGGTVYAVALLGLSFLAKRRTRYRLLSLVAIFAVISLAGCSGGSNNGGGGSSHPSTVTVTATSGTVQHTATIALTIP